jgi:hypothetical protein
VVTLTMRFTTVYKKPDSSLTIVGSMLYVTISVMTAVANLLYQNQIAPRFEFGFGLSYTTFEYSSLTVEKLSYSQQFPEDAIWDSGQTPSTNVTGASRAIWLHRPAYSINFYVQNVGEVSGTEVGLEYFIPGGGS